MLTREQAIDNFMEELHEYVIEAADPNNVTPTKVLRALRKSLSDLLDSKKLIVMKGEKIRIPTPKEGDAVNLMIERAMRADEVWRVEECHFLFDDNVRLEDSLYPAMERARAQERGRR